MSEFSNEIISQPESETSHPAGIISFEGLKKIFRKKPTENQSTRCNNKIPRGRGWKVGDPFSDTSIPVTGVNINVEELRRELTRISKENNGFSE